MTSPPVGVDEIQKFHHGTFDAECGNFAAATGRGSPFHSLEPMGFGPSIRQAADESQPLALRYTALRHALTYSHLGFHAAWAFAETRFGIRKGEQTSSSALKQAAEFFLAERKAWVAFERARISYIRTCRGLGLPTPNISVEHHWSKKNPSQSVAKP